MINISRNNENLLDYKEVHRVLKYNETSGVFTWRIQLSSRGLVGKIAGNIDKGYITITIHRKKYRAHRLAWLYVFGEWPDYIIDHKNRCKRDNPIDNLNDTTQAVNAQNSTPKLGYWKVGNKYRV